MKFQASKADLVEATVAVSTVVPKNPSIQLLGNILIEAGPEGVKLTGSDIETWVAHKVEAAVSVEGETTVPSRIFAELLNSLPEDQVEISMENQGQILIRSGVSKMTLNCTASSDYPRIPTVSSGDKISVDRDMLMAIVEKVTPAISERMEDKREHLGAFLTIKEQVFNLVGTDGQRLSICQIPSPNAPDVDAIVAGTVWRNITKLIGEGENGEVWLTFSPTQLGFGFGKVDVVSRLIDGNYPPYRQIIPQKFDFRVLADKKQLMEALSRVNIIVRQGTKKVTLAIKEGELVCKGIAPELGEVEEKLAVETVGGELELSFDIRKLMDGIKGVDGPRVQINLNGVLHPVLIQAEADDTYRYILVSLRC
jgi:DNA polymerase-3 subunit beta